MDSEYLKRHVGKALSEGLAEICLKRPVDPIEYLAFWLKKYVENDAYENEQKKQEIRLKHEMETAAREAKYHAQMKEEAELIARQEAYELAAAQPVTIDQTPRPLPPELNEALETVTEKEEEEQSETATGELEAAAAPTEPVPAEPANDDIPEEPPTNDIDS